MLAKELRLSRKNFIIAKNSGKNLSGRYFSAIVYKRLTNIKSPSRFSIVVSQKVARKSTQRNHLRRQLYNYLRTTSFKTGNDIIIFPTPPVINLSGEKITSEIYSFLSKIFS